MSHRTTTLSAAFALLTMSCLNIARGQITEAKLLPDYSSVFGKSVSIYGDYALVGAPGDDDNGVNAGAAYIFYFDGMNWLEQAKLIAPDGGPDDMFGYSVSLYGNYALVGMYSAFGRPNYPSAYMFHFDGSSWVQQAQFRGDGGQNSFFGHSVALYGDFAFVGTHNDHFNGEGAGACHVFYFDGSTWVEHSKIVPSDVEAGDAFGYSISLSGECAVIGALGRTDFFGSGSALIFRYDGSSWVEEAELTHSDAFNYDRFGYSVSLSGDYALIGARGNNGSTSYEGAVYAFHYDGTNWTDQGKLVASDGDTYDSFGNSVSISGDYALVGANGDDDAGIDAGAAYIFQLLGSTWVEQTKLVPSDGAAGDGFGESAYLSGNFAIVGTTGSAYVYSASSACDRVSQFQARCRPGGLIKARVTMADASHEGKIIEISIDDVPYEVTIDATGRGQLSQGGFSSGPHTVELTSPGQCFDPIVVTCRTSLDEEASDDWDDELVSESPTETALLGQPARRVESSTFGLAGNYPNPFNPSTTIRYTLSNDGAVSIRVYNMLGQEVATLADGFQKAGEQSVTWNGTNNFGQSVASGLYIYKLQAGNKTLSQKMLFAK